MSRGGAAVALIPARSGSKGIPDKNIRPLAGYPLIAWTIKACLESGVFESVVVSTDSGEYADIARSSGAEVPFLRPITLAGDTSGDLETIVHALDQIDPDGNRFPLVAHMRPTTPLRNPSVVAEAVAAFRALPTATALRSVEKMSESAYKTFEIAESGFLQAVGRADTKLDAANAPRQAFPSTYAANGYVDILDAQFIREANLLHGDAVIPFVTERSPEIDDSSDWAFVEYETQRDPAFVSRLFRT